MESSRLWWVLSISCGLISLLLLLYLAGVNLPRVGQASLALTPGEPKCLLYNFEGELVEWKDIDRCCYYAAQQLQCETQSLEHNGTYTHACHSNSDIKYWLNEKAYRYCKEKPFSKHI